MTYTDNNKIKEITLSANSIAACVASNPDFFTQDLVSNGSNGLCDFLHLVCLKKLLCLRYYFSY